MGGGAGEREEEEALVVEFEGVDGACCVGGGEVGEGLVGGCEEERERGGRGGKDSEEGGGGQSRSYYGRSREREREGHESRKMVARRPSQRRIRAHDNARERREWPSSRAVAGSFGPGSGRSRVPTSLEGDALKRSVAKRGEAWRSVTKRDEA